VLPFALMKIRKGQALALAAVTVAITCAAWAAPRKFEKAASVGRTATVTIGKVTTAVADVTGGGIAAEVINEPAGPSYFVKKHIGQPKYENLSFSVGSPIGQTLGNWVSASWNMSYQRNDLVVAAPGRTLSLNQALIAAVTVPTLDKASREEAKLRITVAPEVIREQAARASNAPEAPHFAWLSSGFRFRLSGIPDTVADAVSRIESFTVKQSTVTDDIGDARDYMREPGKLEFPNLIVTIPAASAAAFKAWHQDFVVQGKNDEAKEKSGSIELIRVDGKVSCTIALFNVGIFGLTPRDGVVVADLYVERMTFAVPMGM
jgi:hypothetical protein